MEYKNLEIDFIDRTLKVIKQYETLMPNLSDENQYDVTLYLNCMTGILLLPRENGFLQTYLPDDTIENWGIARDKVHNSISTIKQLAERLRHCIAHFDAKFKSNEHEKIEKVIFNDKRRNIEIAEFDINDFKIIVELMAEYLVNNARALQ